MNNYTTEQIGPISVMPISGRTQDQYSLVVVQPGTNDQVVVLEPCSWQAGRTRTQEMMARDIDPADIRFVFRGRGQRKTDGLPLRPASAALWVYPEESPANGAN